MSAHWFVARGRGVYHCRADGEEYLYAMAYGDGQAAEVSRALNLRYGCTQGYLTSRDVEPL